MLMVTMLCAASSWTRPWNSPAPCRRSSKDGRCAVKWRMPRSATDDHVLASGRSCWRMFDKVWRRLTERLGGKPQGRLRFAVHRHPSYSSSWQPVERPGEPPRTEIQIYLEAS